jgi:hypothetical protein
VSDTVDVVSSDIQLKTGTEPVPETLSLECCISIIQWTKCEFLLFHNGVIKDSAPVVYYTASLVNQFLLF